MAKIVMSIALFAVLIAVSAAATFGGAHDILGNYYDGTTGQISSSLTGQVYNTRARLVAAPAVVAAAPLISHHAPLLAPAHAPILAHSPLLAAPLHAPLLAPAYAHSYSTYSNIIGRK